MNEKLQTVLVTGQWQTVHGNVKIKKEEGFTCSVTLLST